MLSTAGTLRMNKVSAYLWTLPRWFALPSAVAAIVLGSVISGQSPLVTVIASLAGAMMVAYAHTWNSFQDWVSGFDQGTVSERSHEKPYTGGQNLIARGVVGVWEVCSIAIAYLVLSALFTAFLAAATTPWVWLPWGLIACCAPLYSWGKRTYTCELVLGLGFGPLAVMFGAATHPGPLLLQAFLAGIPLGLTFGYAAEVVDQYIDADANVPKGLRNIGAMCWKKGWGLYGALFIIIILTGVAHVALARVGILSAYSLIGWPFLMGLLYLANKLEKREKLALLTGLGMVFAYPFVVVIMEVIYG